MDNKKRLRSLQDSLAQLSAKDMSHDEFLAWAARTAPLLNFNEYCYRNFQNAARIYNQTDLRAISDPLKDNMKSFVIQATTELEQGLTPKPQAQTSASTGSPQFQAPPTLSLAWLYHNIPIKFWVWLVGSLLVAFMGGMTVGSSEFYDKSIRPILKAIHTDRSDNTQKKP